MREHLDNLPEPEILAEEIIENIEAGLTNFRNVVAALSAGSARVQVQVAPTLPGEPDGFKNRCSCRPAGGWPVQGLFNGPKKPLPTGGAAFFKM